MPPVPSLPVLTLHHSVVPNILQIKYPNSSTSNSDGSTAITIGHVHGCAAFRTFLPRFITKAVIVWVATAALIAGYVIACQMVYISSASFLYDPLYSTAVGYDYGNSSLTALYRNSTHPPLSPDAPLPANITAILASLKLPKAQPLWSKISPTVIQQVLFGQVTNCITCINTGTSPASFPYGMGPITCCTSNVPFALTFVHVLFPVLLCILSSVATACLCKVYLARQWPFHRRHALPASVPLPNTSSSLSLTLDPSKLDLTDVMALGPIDGVADELPAACLFQGRPDFNAELAAIAPTCEGCMIVYACGPLSMRTAVQRAVYGGAWLGGCEVLLHEMQLRD